MMKTILKLILCLLLTCSGFKASAAPGNPVLDRLGAEAGKYPVGTPVTFIFESGVLVTGIYAGIHIDPVSGIESILFDAPINIPLSTYTTPSGVVSTGDIKFTNEKVVDFKFVQAGDSGGPVSGGGGGASSDKVIGDSIADGIMAGVTAGVVIFLTQGSSATKVWGKVKKMTTLVLGLQHAYAKYKKDLQNVGTQKTREMISEQDRQREKFKTSKDIFSQPDPISKLNKENIFFRIQKLTERYRKFLPKTVQQFRLKEVGRELLGIAEQNSELGDLEAAGLALKYATDIADILVGIDPISGVARNIYELYTGKNLITGELLTDSEQSRAGVSLLMSAISLGLSSSILRAAENLSKVFKRPDVFKILERALKSLEAMN